MAEDQEPGLRAALASHCGPMEVDDLPLHPRFATTKVTRPGLVKGSHQPRPFWWQPPNLQRLSTPLIGLDLPIAKLGSPGDYVPTGPSPVTDAIRSLTEPLRPARTSLPAGGYAYGIWL